MAAAVPYFRLSGEHVAGLAVARNKREREGKAHLSVPEYLSEVCSVPRLCLSHCKCASMTNRT